MGQTDEGAIVVVVYLSCCTVSPVLRDCGQWMAK